METIIAGHPPFTLYEFVLGTICLGFLLMGTLSFIAAFVKNEKMTKEQNGKAAIICFCIAAVLYILAVALARYITYGL